MSEELLELKEYFNKYKENEDVVIALHYEGLEKCSKG